MTNETKKYKTKKSFYGILHYVALLGPFIFFCIVSFFRAELTYKLAIPATIIVAGAFTCVGLLRQIRLKIVPYVIILGMHYAIGNIEIVLIVLGIASAFDDLWFFPCYKSAKDKFKINNEIDKRMTNE